MTRETGTVQWRESSSRIRGIVDRFYEGVLLTILLIVPLSYSVGFTTTLLLKETQSTNLIYLLIGVWLIRGLVRGELVYAKTPYNVGLFAFAAWSVVSLFWTAGGIRSSIRDINLMVAYMILFVLLAERLRDSRFRSKALTVVFITAVILSTICFLQFFKAQKILMWSLNGYRPLGNFAGVFLDAAGNPRTDLQRFTIASTIGHNISTATYLMAVCFIALFYVLAGGPSMEKMNYGSRFRKAIAASGNSTGVKVAGWYRVVSAAIFLLLLTFLILVSETRAVYIAYPLGIILAWILTQGIRRESKRAGIVNNVAQSAWDRLTMIILCGGLLVCLAGACLQKTGKIDLVSRLKDLHPRLQAPGTRVRLWTISLDIMRDYPLTGLGMSAFKFRYPEYQARYFSTHPTTALVPTDKYAAQVHNEYLQVPVELGPVGLVLLSLLIFCHFKYVRRMIKAPTSSKSEQFHTVRRVILASGVAAILADAFASFYFHVVSDSLMAVLVGALLVALPPSVGVRTIRIPGLAESRRLRNFLIGGLCVIAVLSGLFGPGLVTWFVPNKDVATVQGPVSHALGDWTYSQTEKEYRNVVESEIKIRGTSETLKSKQLAASCEELIASYSELADSAGKAYALAPYRGQAMFLKGEVLMSLSSVRGLLAESLQDMKMPAEQDAQIQAAIEDAEAARDTLNEATGEYRYHRMYEVLSNVDIWLVYLYRLQLSRTPQQAGSAQEKAVTAKVQRLSREAIAMIDWASRIYPDRSSYLKKLLTYQVSNRDIDGAIETIPRLSRLEGDYFERTMLKNAISVLERIRNVRFGGDRAGWIRLLDSAADLRAKDPTNLPAWESILAKIRSVPLHHKEKDWASILDEARNRVGNFSWDSALEQARIARLKEDPVQARSIVREQRKIIENGLVPLEIAFERAKREHNVYGMMKTSQLLFDCRMHLGKKEEAEKLAFEIDRIAGDQTWAPNLLMEVYYPDRLADLEAYLHRAIADPEKGEVDSSLFFKFTLLEQLYRETGRIDKTVEVWTNLKKESIAPEIRPFVDLAHARALWMIGRYPETLEQISSATEKAKNLGTEAREEVLRLIQRDFASLLIPMLQS